MKKQDKSYKEYLYLITYLIKTFYIYLYIQITDKSDQCQLTEERVYEWLVRNLMRIERALGKERET